MFVRECQEQKKVAFAVGTVAEIFAPASCPDLENRLDAIIHRFAAADADLPQPAVLLLQDGWLTALNAASV